MRNFINTLFLFLIIIAELKSLLTELDDNYLYSEIEENNGQLFTIIKYNNENNLLRLSPSLESQYTMQNEVNINKTLYDTFKKVSNNKKLTINNYNIVVNGIEYNDKIFLGQNYDIVIDNFGLLITEKTKKFYGQISTLSFSHIPKSEKYSIVHQLKKIKKISENKFLILYPELGKRGKIIYGCVPSKIKEIYKYNISIPLSSKKSINWEFPINLVLIGDNLNNKKESKFIINKYKSRFSSNYYQLGVPIEIMKFISENIFSVLIKEGKCIQSNVNYGIECLCEDNDFNNETSFFNSLQNINIAIGNKVITIHSKKFFEKIDNKCIFGMSTNTDFKNEWIFGNRFLQNYISVFDYDNDEVVLMNDKNDNFNSIKISNFLKKKNNKVLRNFIIVAILIALALICRFFYKMYKTRKVSTLNKYINQVYDNFN